MNILKHLETNWDFYLFLIINFVLMLFILYIALKTKYLDFIIDPSSKFYKSRFKSNINNRFIQQQKERRFIKKNIDKINKEKKILLQKTKTDKIASYQSVFYKFYFLLILFLLSVFISYWVFLYKFM
ncbi:MAG: hypothetical protein Q8888_00020 [Vigna little leaf phytoplasma]|nr:hypothetical protein [Vigna little leaf phytoplasma]